MFGCGCWAMNKFNNDECGIAVTTSGCGEHIMRTLLAREIANAMKTSADVSCLTLNENINKLFLSKYKRGYIRC